MKKLSKRKIVELTQELDKSIDDLKNLLHPKKIKKIRKSKLLKDDSSLMNLISNINVKNLKL